MCNVEKEQIVTSRIYETDLSNKYSTAFTVGFIIELLWFDLVVSFDVREYICSVDV